MGTLDGETGVRIVSLDYCPFCDEFVKYGKSDGVVYCSEHGILEGISDEEWAELARERE